MSKVQEQPAKTTKHDASAAQTKESDAEKSKAGESRKETVPNPAVTMETKKESAPTKKPTAKAKSEKDAGASSTQAPSAPATPKSSGNFIAFAGLIIACGALGAGYLAWHKLSQQLQQVVQTAQSSSSSASSAQNTTQTLQQQMNDLQSRVGNELNLLRQHATDVDKTLTAINDRITEDPNDWLIAEARHLVNIANNQAQLNHNIAATIAALEAADQRLRDVGDPSLTPVREAVTADIVALKGIAPIDTTGIALTLNQLEESVNTLPLLNEHAQAPTAEAPAKEIEVTGVRSFFEKVWADIKNLVSIRRNEDEFNTALLPPDQRFFLRQNLRLKLETARLALLQQDTQTFRSTLKTSQQWLNQYFDITTAAVSNLSTTLAEYEKLELRPELPNLSNTLRVMENWQKRQRKLSNGSTAKDQTP